MIHTFSVSNFCSIREKVVLDLRIPGTTPELPRFRRSTARPDIRLPSAVVLIGPNGSGKTALLNALVATARIAAFQPTSVQGSTPIRVLVPFASEKTMDQPTELCVELEGDWLAPGETKHLFRYEVAAERDPRDLDRNRIRYEALSYFPKGRPRRLFQRDGSRDRIFASRDFGVKPKDGRLEAVRPDASVISTLAQLNVPIAMRIADHLGTLAMATNILPLSRHQIASEVVAGSFERNPGLRAWMNERIQCSDLGIRNIEVRSVMGTKIVSFHHHGLDESIDFRFEPSGTKRLFRLLPRLHLVLDRGIPGIFDEIDGDLHVDIATEILNWFRLRETNPCDAQILVTTHNVGLLDDLEKEEVFILEKSLDGATRVHGVQDVRGLRRDARLYPKYRTGVLGGLPRVG